MDNDSAYLFGRRRTLIVFAGLLLGMLLAALNQTIVTTAQPTIAADLGGFEHYSWIFAAYMLTMTVTTPLYGKLSDLYGRRPFFMLAIVLLMAGTVISGVAPSMTVLIVGRAVQGLGAGGLIPLAIAVMGDLVAPRERGKWHGLAGGAFALASVVGPTAGGWISDNASWRWAFFVTLPFGLLTLAVVHFGVRIEPEPGERRVDYAGAALLTAGTSSVLLATMWGGVSYPWGSRQIVGLTAVAAVTLAAFLWWERRARDPILPLGLFRDRTFAAAHVALFSIGAAMFGAFMFTPLFVQGVLGESATSSGAVLTPLILALVGGSVVGGQIVSRTGRYKPVLLGSTLLLFVGFALLSRLGVDSTIGETTGAMLVIGAGLGIGIPTYTLVVQNAVVQRRTGVATASAQFFRSIGATIGVAAMGALLTVRLHAELDSRLPAGADVGAISAGSLLDGSSQPADAETLRAALAAAMRLVFQLGLPLAAIAFVATLFIGQRELRRTIRDPVPGSDVVDVPTEVWGDDEERRLDTNRRPPRPRIAEDTP